jgi:hypothetical protein
MLSLSAIIFIGYIIFKIWTEGAVGNAIERWWREQQDSDDQNT